MAERPTGEGELDEERPSAVFWIVVAAAVFYLGVRLVQGVIWVIDRVA
ncbi:MAG: hypothetical protein HKN74_07835 [Acidimicrobiia bacterium]|nr:hypothetical protein [Acidimicrobiia bacterium]MBT8217366.1 hypothetical protein [Acidimicrobiia bacterium]NNF10178.1 hypothetical protein [Acidimicrobiia bacterium]NNL69074.1 hypothetical protein [Acidimicrobiia bacterium]